MAPPALNLRVFSSRLFSRVDNCSNITLCCAVSLETYKRSQWILDESNTFFIRSRAFLSRAHLSRAHLSLFRKACDTLPLNHEADPAVDLGTSGPHSEKFFVFLPSPVLVSNFWVCPCCVAAFPCTVFVTHRQSCERFLVQRVSTEVWTVYSELSRSTICLAVNRRSKVST